ncbi:MAG TPA: type II toxin-antitoxin system death-on-curing family toxin [Stellaceae bacterium]|nr:type II toxin-antitoxin system death-on-curing family toxin [Stellaceae bacterium]
MTEWRWLGELLVIAVHDEQLAEHGGRAGLRDLALLQSALARPLNLAAYGDPDAFDLAAAYAFGIARNHPFADGNKRTAFVAAAVFLLDNGHEIEATDEAIVTVMLSVSAGSTSERELAAWLRASVVQG